MMDLLRQSKLLLRQFGTNLKNNLKKFQKSMYISKLYDII